MSSECMKSISSTSVFSSPSDQRTNEPKDRQDLPIRSPRRRIKMLNTNTTCLSEHDVFVLLGVDDGNVFCLWTTN